MPSKTCFVVTAIGSNGSPERHHADKVLKYLIQPVCHDLGYKVVRVDQETTNGNINDSIINHLKNDELVIADLTGYNANAFYELGYRQALALPLVPIIKAGEHLPFDVIAERTVFYSMDVSEIEDSKNQLKQMVLDFKEFIMPSQRQKPKTDFEMIDEKLDKIIELLTKPQAPQLTSRLLQDYSNQTTISPDLLSSIQDRIGIRSDNASKPHQ